MPTSELSDALNPYASQVRQRQTAAASAHEYEYSPTTNHQQIVHLYQQPVVQQSPQQHVPHVSELEMAIAQPAAQQPPARSRQGAHVLTELMRMVAATQNAQEIERKRRLTWEQEQEAKVTQIQAGMERKMLEMANELTALRSTVNVINSPVNPPTGLVTPQYSLSPALSQQTTGNMQLTTPISPVSQAACPPVQPMFIQGSSNIPLPPTPVQTGFYQGQATPVLTNAVPYAQHTFQVNTGMPMNSLTPGPSPQLANAETSDPAPTSHSSKPGKRKKRKTPAISSDDEGNSSSSSSSTSSRPRKRKSHHDTRIYTIHHAMRLHMLRMMQVDTDKELPDSHTETTPLGPSEPLRFVWDKTPKQSVHNGRMKKRVLEDIKDNRKRYKHVSNKDFGKKSLDSAFEQCFVTLRQKFKTQRDESAALNIKQREDAKARKSRHLSRRKTKLNNRSEARNNIQIFEHETFDGAFQPDCMSSEESDFEVDPETSQSNPILRTRGYTWRSTRLLRFYGTLDDEDRVEASAKLKRGVGRKERRVGSTKEEFILPPQGVASWMISQRWVKTSLATHPDLPSTLGKLIHDPAGFDWLNFHDLGEASADEGDGQAHQGHQQATYNAHMHTMDLGIPQHHHYASDAYVHYTM